MALTRAPWRAYGAYARSIALTLALWRLRALYGTYARSMAHTRAQWRLRALHGAYARSKALRGNCTRS
jgi:hypothetical protein